MGAIDSPLSCLCLLQQKLLNDQREWSSLGRLAIAALRQRLEVAQLLWGLDDEVRGMMMGSLGPP